ncbi:Mobile element protein [Candidatus Enterovibrio escicola]|uniref:Mobile element protein n=1 Tax=Candidatus Enterovibrio escicola TaxID=1927127 RepID=A0A2A5SZF6_9GAMM|nr:Mobile element protein [Candidatus Enterovibrio escacola]
MMREQGNDKHNISNWKQYNQALVNRGSVTFWIPRLKRHSW